MRHMTPFKKRAAERPRGQALVEFALVLPILALLLVMAIDFGRVFFGWVSLTNSARIGANYAGQHPDLLTKPTERDEYEVLIDDHVTGCDLSPSDLNNAAYDPVFTDMDGDGKDNGWGDHATVTLACEFDLITPLTEVFFGGEVAMAAEAVFPVRIGTFAGPTGGGGGPPNPPCTQKLIPDLINRTLADAQQKWVDEGFLAANFTFSPSTAAPDFLVNSQTFTPAAAVQDCVDPTGQFVHVTTVPPPPCPSGQAQVPDLIGLLVADARDAWTDAGFTGDFNPSNAVDTKTVLTQVTDPVTSPPINGCVTITAEVTITYGDPPPVPCDVPNMIAMTKSEAQAAWTAAGFSTTLTSSGNANGTVYQQTPTHPGTVSCDVVGDVRLRR
jgi:hypothetical protein